VKATPRLHLARVSTTQDCEESRSEASGVVSRKAFVTTRWSVVLRAGASDTTHADDALTRLYQTYWYPLYAYVRGRGYNREDAEDLTQGFFAKLLEKKWLLAADRAKGRFRSFLLTALKCFLADEWDKRQAQKRGGGQALLPLTFDTGEARLNQEPQVTMTPEESFERRWVLTLLEEVMQRLRKEYAGEGNAALFAALAPCLAGERTAFPYADLGKNLSLSESAVKSAVHRLRQRYRKLLREEIAQTVESPDQVEDELRHLFAVLGRAC
jgi:DNA-directed RNA polymerase specialized sigma24 family protein